MTPLGVVAVPSGALAVVDDVRGGAVVRIVGEPGLWRVEGERATGDDDGRWASLQLVPPSSPTPFEEPVALTSGRLLLVDAGALDACFDETPVDGLGDCVFGGRDAREAARTLGASELEGRLFGWVDEPASEARRLFKRVVFERDERGLVLSVEERPHTHRFRARAMLAESPLAVAAVELPGRPGLLAATTWGPCRACVGSAAGDIGVRIRFAPSGSA
ncbi:MAG: hypothetical protein RL199_2519 [Pseudomonadota bacterium]